MKVIDKQHKFGPRKAFDNVDPRYTEFRAGIRVLPAPYFEDRKTMFVFVAEYAPGTPGWLDGGYEVRGPNNEFRAYYLDQLILHPEVIKRRYGKSVLRLVDEQRGRKASGVVKEKSPNATGKRGRPSVPEHLRKNKPYVPTGLPRGRRKKQ